MKLYDIIEINGYLKNTCLELTQTLEKNEMPYKKHIPVNRIVVIPAQ